MKAYVLKAVNDLTLDEVETPVPGDGEVLVKVRAAGICGSDIPRVYQTGTYSFPLTPGHEFAGEVVETGVNVNPTWMGKRVGVFPLIPCMKCLQCRAKKYEMCSSYNYLGSRCDGGFAEYVVVPEWNLIELPANVSFEAAAMLEPMCVAAHAIRNLSIKLDDTIAVCGLGTIGLMIMMLLRVQGIKKVLAIGNKTFQLEIMKKMGYKEDCFCDASKEDVGEWIAERTEKKGVNIYLECVGKNETIAQAIENAAPGGVVRLIGNPATDIMLQKKIYWKILRKQLSVSGTWNSSFTKEADDDWNYILQLLESGQLQPERLITHRFPFAELIDAFTLMHNKTVPYTKIITYL